MKKEKSKLYQEHKYEIWELVNQVIEEFPHDKKRRT